MSKPVDDVNRPYVLFHLREAMEQLQETIAALETDQDFGVIEFRGDMEHLYNHLNTAWNARNASDEQCSPLSHEDFVTWRQFPSDIDLSA